MIKAIFFDIDSTTYIHAIKDSPESTKTAFKKLKEAGYRLGICTSRSYPEMVNLPDHFWQTMDAVVCLGGAQILIDGKLVVNHPLDEEIQAVIQKLDETSTPYRWVCSNTEGYLSQRDQWVEDLNTFLYQMIPPIKKYNQEELVHLLLYPEDESLREEIKNMCRKNYYIRLKRSSEITAPGINKGHGIVECASFWGIAQNEIAAFGDGNNDLPMIETAEIGIAMGNASELLKQKADYITDDIDKDGLYKACIHFGWIREDE